MSLVDSSQLCWATQALSSYLFVFINSIPEMFNWGGGGQDAPGGPDMTWEGDALAFMWLLCGFYVALLYLCRVMPAIPARTGHPSSTS